MTCLYLLDTSIDKIVSEYRRTFQSGKSVPRVFGITTSPIYHYKPQYIPIILFWFSLFSSWNNAGRFGFEHVSFIEYLDQKTKRPSHTFSKTCILSTRLLLIDSVSLKFSLVHWTQLIRIWIVPETSRKFSHQLELITYKNNLTIPNLKRKFAALFDIFNKNNLVCIKRITVLETNTHRVMYCFFLSDKSLNFTVEKLGIHWNQEENKILRIFDRMFRTSLWSDIFAKGSKLIIRV